MPRGLDLPRAESVVLRPRAPVGHRTPRTGTPHWPVERYGLYLILLGGLCTVGGVLAWSRHVVAAAVFLVGMGYFLRDYGRRATITLNPMSLYMLSASLWFGLANLVGFLLLGTRFDPLFVDWRVDAYLETAQMVAAIGALAPPFGYAAAARMRAVGFRLPPIGFTVSDRTSLQFAAGFFALTWIGRFAILSPSALGILSSLVIGGANIAIFLVSLYLVSGRCRRPAAWRILLAAMVAEESTYQFAYSFLRSDALIPIAVALIPFAIHKRLSPRVLLVAAALSVAFVLVMQPFADLRSSVSGSERLSRLVGSARLDTEGLADGAVTLVSRLSTFSQLSQVCRIVNEEGYQDGETMTYVVFAFIPRVLWRAKPQIAPGQWFAEKLGRGTKLDTGRFSNAINMTVPGELFLNFGWVWTVLGMAIIGAIYFFLWDIIQPQLGRNPIAGLLGCVILTQAMLPAGHFGSVLNPILWYLLSLPLGVVQQSLSASSVDRPQAPARTSVLARRLVQTPKRRTK